MHFEASVLIGPMMIVFVETPQLMMPVVWFTQLEAGECKPVCELNLSNRKPVSQNINPRLVTVMVYGRSTVRCPPSVTRTTISYVPASWLVPEIDPPEERLRPGGSPGVPGASDQV